MRCTGAVCVGATAAAVSVLFAVVFRVVLPSFAASLGLPVPFDDRLNVPPELLWLDDNGTFVGTTYWPSQWYGIRWTKRGVWEARPRRITAAALGTKGAGGR
jgi:hypothetical protein